MDLGTVFWEAIGQAFDVENTVKALFLNPCVVKGSNGLVAQRATIHQEKHSFETLRLNHAVHDGNGSSGFACARRHG